MRLLFLFALNFFLIGCATEPLVTDSKKVQGQWETKAQVKDFKRQKTTSLSIDFVAIKQERLRAEVTGPMGVSVATLVMSREQIQMAIHTQKKFYSGKLSERALTSLIGVSLDPRILYFVLFDDPLPAKSFNCTNDSAGMVQECQGKTVDLKIKWSERQGELKRVSITRKDFEVQILVKNFTTKVQDSAEVFVLNVPEAYKTYQLD